MRKNGKWLRETERSLRNAPVPPAERCGAERSPGAERSRAGPQPSVLPLRSRSGACPGASGLRWGCEGFWVEKRQGRGCEEAKFVENLSRAVCPPLQWGRIPSAARFAGGRGWERVCWAAVRGCGGLRGAAGGCGAGGSRAAALLAGPGGRGCHRAGGGEAGLGRGRWYLPQKCSNPLPSLLSARWAHCDGDAALSARGLRRPPADSRRLLTAADL